MKRRDFIKTAIGAAALIAPLPDLIGRDLPASGSVIDFLQAQMAAGNFPGYGLLVYHNGQKMLENYAGTYCNGETREAAMGPEVINRLYSFSKGVSATVVVMAHQKGLVDYDAPLYTYVPSYRGGWKDQTTIRHLLTHTAGIPGCDLGNVLTEDEWQKALRTCAKYKVEWEPGSRAQYHARAAMFLAAEAVRSQLPGRPSWESICREWLLDPIGASTMTFALPEEGPISFTPQPRKLPTTIAEQPTNLGQPGSGIFGRLDDMIRVIQLHLNGGTWGNRVLIEPAELAEMHRIQYREQIVQARAEKRSSPYATFGLGWKIKLTQTNDWFGLGSRTREGTFGHAGIDTVLGVGVPQQDLAITFAATNSPPKSEVSHIRNGVTDRVTALI